MILFPDQSKPSREQAQDLLARWPVAVATTASSSLSESSLSIFYETARTLQARTLPPPPPSSPRPSGPLPFLHLPPTHLKVLHHPALLRAEISKSSRTHPRQLSSSKNFIQMLSIKKFYFFSQKMTCSSAPHFLHVMCKKGSIPTS